MKLKSPPPRPGSAPPPCRRRRRPKPACPPASVRRHGLRGRHRARVEGRDLEGAQRPVPDQRPQARQRPGQRATVAGPTSRIIASAGQASTATVSLAAPALNSRAPPHPPADGSCSPPPWPFPGSRSAVGAMSRSPATAHLDAPARRGRCSPCRRRSPDGRPWSPDCPAGPAWSRPWPRRPPPPPGAADCQRGLQRLQLLLHQPPGACGSSLAMPSVEACARCAAEKASLT
jgi:hypothetical protein